MGDGEHGAEVPDFACVVVGVGGAEAGGGGRSGVVGWWWGHWAGLVRIWEISDGRVVWSVFGGLETGDFEEKGLVMVS